MAIELSALMRPRSLEAGEWVELDKDVELLIRPYGNRDFDLFVTQRLMDKNAALIDDDAEKSASAEDASKSEAEAVAHTILAGWKGPVENGEPVKYTPELGVQLFNADYLTYKFVREQSFRLMQRMNKRTKDAEGNSGSSSPGS